MIWFLWFFIGYLNLRHFSVQNRPDLKHRYNIDLVTINFHFEHYQVQLHNREDVEKLIADHKADGKLLVLDVGLKHCGPCVKVYPTVVKLSKQMDTVVFARMNGDENDSCMQFLKDMDVVEVPTFLFIRDGEISGRYVGSGRGELIGEILRYQGVRVTY